MNNQIISKIKGSPLIVNTLKLSVSNVILMFLPLVVTPILSRLYSPAEYGVWGIFASVMFIVNSFICLSYENTIIQTDEESEVPSLLMLCTMIAICISIMATGLFYIGRFLHISFFENFPSPIILFISTVATAAFTIAVNIANRIKKYGLISIANTINGASQAIIRIIFGIFPVVINGLIWGNIIAHILGFLFIISILLAYLKHFEWRSLSFDVIKGIAYKYKKFPLYDAPAKFIEFTVSNIVIIILSFYFGQDEIGCFSMIMQFILLPVTVIGAAMGNVYYKDLSENQNDRVKIAQSTIKVGKITLYLAIIPIVFLALGGDKLFVLFLGQGWSNAGLMALCLSIYSVPVILTQPLLPAFRTLNRQELRFKYNIINLVSSILILCVVSKVFDNIYISLISYSIASAFVRFCIYFSIMKITDVKLKHISKYALYVIFIPYIILMLRLIIKL